MHRFHFMQLTVYLMTLWSVIKVNLLLGLSSPEYNPHNGLPNQIGFKRL